VKLKRLRLKCEIEFELYFKLTTNKKNLQNLNGALRTLYVCRPVYAWVRACVCDGYRTKNRDRSILLRRPTIRLAQCNVTAVYVDLRSGVWHTQQRARTVNIRQTDQTE